MLKVEIDESGTEYLRWRSNLWHTLMSYADTISNERDEIILSDGFDFSIIGYGSIAEDCYMPFTRLSHAQLSFR